MKNEQPFYHEHIVTDPRILAGKPVIKETRIAVDLVLEELAHNPDINELLAAHPDLSQTDVQACLAYAKAIVAGEGHGSTDSEIALDRASDVFYPTNPDRLLRRETHGRTGCIWIRPDRGHGGRQRPPRAAPGA